jgi:hypothetical protein
MDTRVHGQRDCGAAEIRGFSMPLYSLHSRPTRAIGRNRSIGRPRVVAVRLDGLDHEIEFIGAVDLPGHAVILVWCDEVGFGEVVQAIDPADRVIFHEEHNTGAVFHPREQEQRIGAEVEHGGEDREREPQFPPPWQRR